MTNSQTPAGDDNYPKELDQKQIGIWKLILKGQRIGTYQTFYVGNRDFMKFHYNILAVINKNGGLSKVIYAHKCLHRQF